MGDDPRRHRAAETRDLREEGRGGRVDVHPHGVDRVLHHRRERPRQLRLAHVVLVLPDADRLGVDLDQFRQGILETAGDRRRAAMGHVEVGQFLGGDLRGRVDRGAGLGDHHLRERQVRVGRDDLRGEALGLAGSGAVADGEKLHAVQPAQPAERRDGLAPAPLRLVRVGRLHRDDPPGSIRHGDLHAVPVARIEPHRRPPARRGSEQQVLQVPGEDCHGLVLGPLEQTAAQVLLDSGPDLHPPRRADRVEEPGIAGAPPRRDLEAAADRRLERPG